MSDEKALRVSDESDLTSTKTLMMINTHNTIAWLLLGSERASFFRQTGGGHLAVGSSILFKRSLDGHPPFAENDSLFRSLLIMRNSRDPISSGFTHATDHSLAGP